MGVAIAQGEVKVHTSGVEIKNPKDFKLVLKIRNKGFMCCLCIIFPTKFQVVLNKISY